MVGSLDVGDAVVGGIASAALGAFLQLAFRVPQSDGGMALDGIAGNSECEGSSGIESLRDVDRADDGFDDVGEDFGSCGIGSGASAETNPLEQVDFARECRESFGVDERGAHACETAFARRGDAFEKQLGHAKPEHSVAEQLELLVVDGAGMFVDEAGVGQGFDDAGDVAVDSEVREKVVGVVHGMESVGGNDGADRIDWEPHDTSGVGTGRRDVVKVMGYAALALSDLLACPFCRELYQPGEAKVCPTCGLSLTPMSKLPLSYEAQLEEPWPEKPEWETLPWAYWRRGRGALVVAGLLGVALFFVPWIHVTAPEVATYTGFDLARALGWIWGCLVAWVMLVATAASRRSVAKMRGARVAAALFCAVPVVTVIVIALTPPSSGVVPVRFTYVWPFYASAVLGALALGFAVRLGGSLSDLPVPRGGSHGETLH